MVRVGRRTGIARYHQVYTLLVQSLADGSVAPGSALPSEAELMQQYRVSRNTVRHALARLEQEKRIIKRRGSGTFARQSAASGLSVEQIVALSDNLAAVEKTCAARILQFGRVSTPAYILHHWPDFEAASILVQRTRGFKGQVFAHMTCYIAASLGRKLTRTLVGDRSITTVLDALGIFSGTAEQSCRAVAADAIVAQHLGIMPGSPLLAVTRWVRDNQNQPLQYQQLLYRSDLYELRIPVELERGDNSVRWVASGSAASPRPSK